MVNNKDINRQVNFEKIMLNFCQCWQRESTKQEHREFTTQPVGRQTSTSGDVSDCVDMTSKCESVSLPIETLFLFPLKLRLAWVTHRQNRYKPVKSLIICLRKLWQLSLEEDKSPDMCQSVSFSDEYRDHTNDRGYAAFHEELHPDVIRGKLSGLSDRSVQRRITNLSRNKTIKKVALHRCWNRETLVCESDDFIFQFDLKKRIFATLVHQIGLQKGDCPWKWGSVRRYKLGFGGYSQVHIRAGIPLVLSSYRHHSCSAIFLRCLKLWILYTLSGEISAMWHLGTEVTGVAFVTWSPWHMWTIAPWIPLRFFMIESLLHNYFV